MANGPFNSGSASGGTSVTGESIFPHITLIAPTGSSVSISNSGRVLEPAEYEGSGIWEQNVPYFGTWKIEAQIDGQTVTKEIEITELTRYTVRLSAFNAVISVTAPKGTAITVEKGTDKMTGVSDGTAIEFPATSAGIWKVTGVRTPNGESKAKTVEETVDVTAETEYGIALRGLVLYGFRKKKSEGNPSARIEYLYDAVGKTPAHMDFDQGTFDYGDWGDVWFVKDNKPLMLKSNRKVDYYLNPDDYTLKEDGTASDIKNTAYDGNGMAQFPLAYFRRYEDATYEYEIVSDGPYSEEYKAYAHTRADGSIANYFYWSLFGGSGSASKIRSIADQTLARSLTAENEIAGAKANGDGWYTHTWSQRCYITTLLVLMGKSTNTQAVFGNGNAHSGSEGDMKTTGTLLDKGQFFGYSSTNHQVKVFHVEKFWGDQWDRTAGVINNNGPIYVKMTPEGDGYRITDVNGYTNSGVTCGGTSGGYISATECSDLGCLPVTFSGSETTNECDGGWFNNNQLDYLFAGAYVGSAAGIAGAFAFHVYIAPAYANWNYGCGLSCEEPVAA